MCLPPLIIAGMAAMAAGGAMKYFGQQKADHALTKTFSRERDRQKAFEAEQTAKFQDSLNSTDNIATDGAQAAATAKRDAAIQGATKSAVGAYLPGSGSANKVVATQSAAAGAAANKRTQSLGSALAALGGMSDLMLENNINIGHNSQAIDQLTGFRRGSLDALQPEMDAAKLKGGNLKMLGGLAQSIGQMMVTGGAGGGLGPMDVTIGSASPLASVPGFTPELLNSLPGMVV